MRKIDFDNIEESTEGGFDRLEAGNYVCTVTAAEDFEKKEYVRLLVDIAEGPREGFFSDPFYSEKPWAHNVVLSYKETAQKMLKGRLHVLTDCNPGFDAQAAWNGGRLDMFVGKSVGVCFNEEEYEGNDGKVKTNVKPGALVRIDDIRDGTAREPRHKRADGTWVSLDEAKETAGQAVGNGASYAAPAPSAQADGYEDIPF